MTASIPRFIPFEVRGIDTFCGIGFFTALRHGTLVPVIRMEIIVYMAHEVVTTMKPWSGPYEDATIKPLRAIVTSGSTRIRWHVVVSIRTVRGYSDVDAYLSPG
jgi:hypothetical protein